MTTKGGDLKLVINTKQLYKTFSLLLLLKERRTKSFPQVLAIIELLFQKVSSRSAVATSIKRSCELIIAEKLKDPSNNEYDILWLAYFIKANKLFSIKWPRKLSSEFMRSIKNNKQQFFSTRGITLYSPISATSASKALIDHLIMFPKAVLSL